MTPELVTFFHDITKQYDTVKVIYNKQNYGLGKAQNQGINKSRELGATSIVLLDHDSILKPLFIQKLYTTFSEMVECGCKIGALGQSISMNLLGKLIR